MSVRERNRKLTIEMLRAILPEVDWLLEHMEKNGGWLNISGLLPNIIDNIAVPDFPGWQVFYLDENRLKTLGMLPLYDLDELKAVTPETSDNFKEQSKRDALELLSEIGNVEFPSRDELVAHYEDAGEDDRNEMDKEFVIGFMAFITVTLNYLALMTFGKTLCKLVEQAQQNNIEADKALCQAVQIDRTILQLPFVQTRLLRAQLDDDVYFLEQLGNHIKRPILSGKIRYRKLWLTFAILEEEGFLKMPQEQLLDLLQDLGVYGKPFGVEDVGHLRQRLFEYRKKSPLGKKTF